MPKWQVSEMHMIDKKVQGTGEVSGMSQVFQLFIIKSWILKSNLALLYSWNVQAMYRTATLLVETGRKQVVIQFLPKETCPLQEKDLSPGRSPLHESLSQEQNAYMLLCSPPQKRTASWAAWVVMGSQGVGRHSPSPIPDPPALKLPMLPSWAGNFKSAELGTRARKVLSAPVPSPAAMPSPSWDSDFKAHRGLELYRESPPCPSSWPPHLPVGHS